MWWYIRWLTDEYTGLTKEYTCFHTGALIFSPRVHYSNTLNHAQTDEGVSTGVHTEEFMNNSDSALLHHNIFCKGEWR
jgi:hypothetical protein